MESNHHTSIEHQNVPTAHQGLHSFLYNNEDEHNLKDQSTILEFDGTTIVEVDQWQNLNMEGKVAGVYAVINKDNTYQYVGYSRDILRSLKGHIAQHGKQICALTRVKTFKFPRRQEMEKTKGEWLNELDYTPIGNTENNSQTWASTIKQAAQATMTETERSLYEEKKLKLRKAMADTSLIDELEKQDTQTEAEIQRRQNLEAAVKNDDWSSVIEAQ